MQNAQSINDYRGAFSMLGRRGDKLGEAVADMVEHIVAIPGGTINYVSEM